MNKMEDKIFEKFDNELNAQKNIEQTVISFLYFVQFFYLSIYYNINILL